MRLQRLIIPVLFALLLLVAYVVAAQTDENLPEPYQAPTLVIGEPVALDMQAGQPDALMVTTMTAVCEMP